MSTTFHRIHLLHAALQVKGASVAEIEMIKAMVAKLGGARFDEWNKPLDAQGTKLLTCILAEGGISYANLAIDEFLKRLTGHFQISSEEIQKALRARLEGLN